MQSKAKEECGGKERGKVNTNDSRRHGEPYRRGEKKKAQRQKPFQITKSKNIYNGIVE